MRKFHTHTERRCESEESERERTEGKVNDEDDISDEDDLSYEDMCTECNMHDTCHKNGIDYDEIEKCNKELRVQWQSVKKHKTPEPKEVVQFN